MSCYYIDALYIPAYQVKYLIVHCCKHDSCCLSVCPLQVRVLPERFGLLKFFCTKRWSDVSSFLAWNFVVLNLGFHPVQMHWFHPVQMHWMNTGTPCQQQKFDQYSAVTWKQCGTGRQDVSYHYSLTGSRIQAFLLRPVWCWHIAAHLRLWRIWAILVTLLLLLLLFLLVPKSVTSNDREWRNSHYFAPSHRNHW